MTLLVLLATALAAPAQAMPPPIVAPSAVPRGELMLVEFAAGEGRCGRVGEAPIRTVAPDPTTAFATPNIPPSSYTVPFSIDETGRPVDIADPVRAEGEGVLVSTIDLAPALSLWRFAPGRRRERCSVTFAARPMPFASAPADIVFRYLSVARPGQSGREAALARIRRLDCAVPALPRLLLRAYPDYDSIRQEAGTTAHSVVRFDIDDQGNPRNASTLSSGGNVELDAQAIDAVARSRYASGDPRAGCIMPFLKWTRAANPAPIAPAADGFRPERATCGKVEWQQMPRMAFPAGFERRSAEGWAIVRFDLAPSGAPGNVEVTASEPAQAFGRQARSIIGRARGVASSAGATGCIERIVFRIADSREPPAS